MALLRNSRIQLREERARRITESRLLTAMTPITVLGVGESAVSFLLKCGKYFSAWTPDLIFLDPNLPKLSGVEILEALSSSPKLPFCILTSSTLERDNLKKKFGIRRIAYVVKPVTRDMILYCFRCYDHLAPLLKRLRSGISETKLLP